MLFGNHEKLRYKRHTQTDIHSRVLQDNSVNAHSCREPGRQQVLAGRRQGHELDLLGSFPSDSGCFQHPRAAPSTHPPNSTGMEREGGNKRWGVREYGKDEVNRERRVAKNEKWREQQISGDVQGARRKIEPYLKITVEALALYFWNHFTFSQVKLDEMVIMCWIIRQDSKTNHYQSPYGLNARWKKLEYWSAKQTNKVTEEK